MKVKDLIEALDGLDPESNVLFLAQPHYPFEYAIQNIVIREDVSDSYDDEDIEEEQDTYLTRGKASDVLLIEGKQLRYASKDIFK